MIKECPQREIPAARPIPLGESQPRNKAASGQVSRGQPPLNWTPDPTGWQYRTVENVPVPADCCLEISAPACWQKHRTALQNGLRFADR